MSDAGDIARIMRAALSAFDWMPLLHTPEEDFAFIRDTVLPGQQVTVAEADNTITGFIAVHGDSITQLYLRPGWTGQGIGMRLLNEAVSPLAVVRLYCFQANTGARRFYERQGFEIEATSDGSSNEEGLPDLLYVRRPS